MSVLNYLCSSLTAIIEIAVKSWGELFIFLLLGTITEMKITQSSTKPKDLQQCCPTFLIPRAAQGLILKPQAEIVSSKTATKIY